jgi:hypothetical protein
MAEPLGVDVAELIERPVVAGEFRLRSSRSLIAGPAPETDLLELSLSRRRRLGWGRRRWPTVG